MLLRALCVLLAVPALAGAVAIVPASAQSQAPDLGELWQRYPLEAPPPEQRSVGVREENGSLAGPPPADEAEPAGPLPELAFLFLALALAVVGLTGGARQGLGWLRARRRGRLGAGAGDLGG